VPSRRYATHDGLPSKQITALAQTPNGLLWIGTQNGLAVYDGYQFRRIPTPDSVRQKQVNTLRPMPDGSVWVGMGHDAMRVAPHGVVQVLLLGDHLNSEILRRGESVVFVTDRSVWTLGPNQSRPTRTPLRFPTPGIRNVWGADLDPEGRLWIAVGSDGPARVAPDGQVTYPAASVFDGRGGRDAPIYDVRFLGGTEALVAWGAGMYRYDWAAQTLDRVGPVAPGALPDIRGAREGGLYLTGGPQVRRYDAAAGRMQAPIGPADPNATTTAALQGREGGLWVGTENGLLSFPNPEARHVRSIGGTTIRDGTGFRAKGGTLWANTWGAGIFQIRPRRRSMRPEGYAQWVFLRSGDGRVHGLANASDESHRQWFRWAPGAGWKRVGSASGGVRGYVDAGGVGYFWHNDGLYRHTPRGDTIEATQLRSWPLDDSQHHLMGPAPNGDLVLFDEGTVLRLRRPDGIVIDTLASVPAHAESQGRRLQVDAAGRVWCPFRGAGLLRVDPEQGTAETLLKGAVVESVSMADSLALVKTTNGLYLLSARTGRVRHRLTQADGLFSNDVNGAQIVGDTLYVGHKAGVALLPVDSFLDPPPAPHATLTGLEVNFDDRPLRANADWAAEERTVGFSYTGASLAHPDQVRYEVRLAPRDSAWKATDRRFARYTDLAPGTYRFEVRARRAGHPPGPPASYSFTIPPRFYETGWFRLLVVLLGIGGIGGAYRWRVYRLRQRQAELRRAVEARTQELAAEKKKTEAQAERLAELDEAKNRFFAHISHEFRTPLSLILSPLRDALQRASAPSVTFGGRQVRRMTRNAERLQRLIDQLLDLATLEAGRMELDRRPADLAVLVERSVEAFRSRAEQKEVGLRVETPAESMPMLFDPEKVETIVSNLVGNALKFVSSGEQVTVRVGRADGTGAVEAPKTGEAAEGAAIIEVADTGPGMDPEVQDDIFDRFAQADTSATRGHEGTGLGLALTKELVELHGGTVEVDSVPGEGATFTVRLPRVPVAAEAVPAAENGARDGLVRAGMGTQRPVPEAACATEGATDGDAATVLVVEDNAEMRAYLHEELAEQWHVITAADGEAGWERVQADEPDLVVSDVMMPGLSGTDLCRRIKSDEARRAIPVLLLTARAGEEATVEGLEAGADDYVAKPFGPDELRGRIENHLAARRHLEARYRQEVAVEALEAVVELDEQPFVERVLTAAGEQLSNPDFGVGALAEEMALSRRQLTRRLKQAVGEPPGQVLRQLRIERGKALLREGAETVSEVAYATGFRSPSAFSHAFGEVVGQTPTEYVEEQRE